MSEKPTMNRDLLIGFKPYKKRKKTKAQRKKKRAQPWVFYDPTPSDFGKQYDPTEDSNLFGECVLQALKRIAQS